MKTKHIIIFCGLLVVIIAVLALANRPETDTDQEQLAIIAGGEVAVSYTLDEIIAMPYVEVEKEISSASYADVSGLWRGVPLRDLLEAAVPGRLAQSSQVVTRARDNFVAAFAAEEVAEDEGIIVAYSLDGESLGTMEDGGSGPLRLVIVGDPFGNRSTRWLYQIELK